MRSKLIRMRGPTIAPIMFLLVIVAGCLFIALSAKVADNWRESQRASQIDLSLCPLCGHSVVR